MQVIILIAHQRINSIGHVVRCRQWTPTCLMYKMWTCHQAILLSLSIEKKFF